MHHASQEPTQDLYNRHTHLWIRKEPTILSDYTARPRVLESVGTVDGLDILDLGCGCGALGISIVKALGTRCEQLVLADLSKEALDLAQENCQALSIDAEFIESDLFSNVSGTFDIIVANLPYIAEHDRCELSPEVLHDPEMALFSGEDGLDHLRRFCKECSPFLNPRGLVALEVGHNQGDEVAELLRRAGLSNIEVQSDLCGIARFPIGRKL